ncbi:DUF4185 domain-containing protein [Nakamurella aerolata]|uniref:DUF4185 domain-containing protein n=1 Tax=Nakamurella aerolata TaxID=1656892 RepID=UPI001BB1A13D
MNGRAFRRRAFFGFLAAATVGCAANPAASTTSTSASTSGSSGTARPDGTTHSASSAGTAGGSAAGGSAALAASAATSRTLTGVDNVTRVAQLTGPGGINNTAKYRIAGTDLGSMFEHNGKTWFVFGDTFGRRAPGQTGGGGDEWRSNALAYSTDADPADGITFDGFVTDQKTGWALEPIPGEKIDNQEMTKIPTYGFSAGGAMYLAYMSVKHWGEPGEWETNYSGLAKSTDDGKTWTQLATPKWSGTSNFVQVSVVERDGMLYFLGVTHGRFGPVRLMRVPTAEVEKPASYQYFSGTAADGSPQWSADEKAAAVVLDDTVGELSAAWNAYLDSWILTYSNGNGDTTIRQAPQLWGPWGPARTLIAQSALPGLYSPYLLPKYTADGGRTVYFTLSVWDPYQVFWYRADLTAATGDSPASAAESSRPAASGGVPLPASTSDG